MRYFLGIVPKERVAQGIFEPLFVLCLYNGSSDIRSGLTVKRTEDPDRVRSKLLVSSVIGHEDIIDYMSHYRTRDYIGRTEEEKRNNETPKQAKLYFPEGALCWFPCNAYGERAGPALFIYNVPKIRLPTTSIARNEVARSVANKPHINDVLSKDINFIDYESSSVKIKIVQYKKDAANSYKNKRKKKKDHGKTE